MNRQQKATIVDEVQKLFSESDATFVIGYKGLDVALMQNLRKSLRENAGTIKVAKTTLMKRAIKDVPGVDAFAQQLKTQVGLVFAANGEVSSVAKKLVNFSKDHELMQVLSGFFESKSISKQEIELIASLPSREVLLGQLVGTIGAPTANLVYVLNAMLAKLVYVLQQVSEKKSAEN